MPSAADIIAAKVPLPLSLTAEEWARVQADKRRRAIFAALVDEIGALQEAQYQVAAILSGESSKVDARLELSDVLAALNYMPGEGAEGGIQDLRTVARQNLILETNLTMAAGEAQREMFRGSYAYPAQRLVRLGQRTEPRDWPSRWRMAYAEVGGAGACATDMVALNDSPIWTALSAFGQPYPPFDYNSGMGLEPVDYDEAEALGLITDDALDAIAAAAETPPEPPSLQANMAALSTLPAEIQQQAAAIRQQAIDLMRGAVTFDGDTLRWTD